MLLDLPQIFWGFIDLFGMHRVIELGGSIYFPCSIWLPGSSLAAIPHHSLGHLADLHPVIQFNALHDDIRHHHGLQPSWCIMQNWRDLLSWIHSNFLEMFSLRGSLVALPESFGCSLSQELRPHHVLAHAILDAPLPNCMRVQFVHSTPSLFGDFRILW